MQFRGARSGQGFDYALRRADETVLLDARHMLAIDDGNAYLAAGLAGLGVLRTPDGQGIELDKFHTPDAVRFGPVEAPVNALGLRRVMFAVDDIDAMVARMRERGDEIIGEMRYGESYRLAYIRGPEGGVVGLAASLGGA